MRQATVKHTRQCKRRDSRSGLTSSVRLLIGRSSGSSMGGGPLIGAVIVILAGSLIVPCVNIVCSGAVVSIKISSIGLRHNGGTRFPGYTCSATRSFALRERGFSSTSSRVAMMGFVRIF